MNEARWATTFLGCGAAAQSSPRHTALSNSFLRYPGIGPAPLRRSKGAHCCPPPSSFPFAVPVSPFDLPYTRIFFFYSIAVSRFNKQSYSTIVISDGSEIGWTIYSFRDIGKGSNRSKIKIGPRTQLPVRDVIVHQSKGVAAAWIFEEAWFLNRIRYEQTSSYALFYIFFSFFHVSSLILARSSKVTV